MPKRIYKWADGQSNFLNDTRFVNVIDVIIDFINYTFEGFQNSSRLVNLLFYDESANQKVKDSSCIAAQITLIKINYPTKHFMVAIGTCTYQQIV